MIVIKTKEELKKIYEAGNRLGKLFDYLKPFIKPGISTHKLDKLAEAFIRESGCIPSCLHYEGYPASICASVNDVLVHGIPSPKIILKEGDIVSIDVCNLLDGFQSDACRTFAVGKISEDDEKLISVTEECFYAGLAKAIPGNRIGDISHAIETTAKSYGFSVTEYYGGHGIGREMHEDPMILNYGRAGYGPLIREGMALCIEPMLLKGSKETVRLKDGWGEVSIDKQNTAHYENTVLITSDGPIIATIDSNVLRHLKGGNDVQG